MPREHGPAPVRSLTVRYPAECREDRPSSPVRKGADPDYPPLLMVEVTT